MKTITDYLKLEIAVAQALNGYGLGDKLKAAVDGVIEALDPYLKGPASSEISGKDYTKKWGFCDTLAEGERLLLAIDKNGKLCQGGEQYPNGLNCLDMANQLRKIREHLAALPKRESRRPLIKKWRELADYIEGAVDIGSDIDPEARGAATAYRSCADALEIEGGESK